MLPDEDRASSTHICAFGPCTCTIDDTDRFCGPSCRMGLGDKNEPCKCGHAGCTSTVGEG
jgi:hypothetical protein